MSGRDSMASRRPDILDLNDWAVMHAPESYAVAKYLDFDNYRAVLEAAWVASGKPELAQAELDSDQINRDKDTTDD